MRTKDEARNEACRSLIGLIPIEIRESASKEDLAKIQNCLDQVFDAGSRFTYGVWKDGCAMSGSCYLSVLLS